MYPQLPPFTGYGPYGISLPAGHSFFPAGPNTFPAGPSMFPTPTRDPPSSPPTANCMITQFCDTYYLGEHAEVGLKKLGF